MRFLFLLQFIAISHLLFGQNTEIPKKWIKEQVVNLCENQSMSIDQSDLEMTMQEWLENPLKLNKASIFDLNKFIFLSPIQKANMLKHINTYGPFLDKYELQAIDGFDEKTAQLLSYFISIENRNAIDYYSLKEILAHGNNELLLGTDKNFQSSKGFDAPQQFVGSNQRLAMRYRFALANKLYFGCSFEKDAGEKWGTIGDFQGFHLVYKGKGLLQTLAIGDYQANFGKGLSIGSSMFNGKSSLIFQNQYLNEGIRAYRSLNESGFFRGIAIGLKKNNFNFNLMLSILPQSALVEYDSLMLEDKIGSIIANGLHRTQLELAKKNSVLKTFLGLQINYQKKKLQLGASYNKQENIANYNLNSDLKNWQNPFLNSHFGLSANYYLKNILLGAEFSYMENGAQGIIANSLIPLHGKLDAMLIYRNYSKGFKNNYGNVWSANSGIGDENGTYLAFSYRPKKYHQIDFYSDVFRTNGPSYQSAYANLSNDYFVHYTWQQSKTFQIEMRFRQQETEKNLPSEMSRTKTMAAEIRSQFRFQANYSINKAWTYQFRAEKIIAQKPDGIKYAGQLIFHDLNYHPKGEKISLHARFCLFQIEDFSARIYMQEGDVIYNYAQTQLNGNGFRTYLIAGYRIGKKTQLQIKIAQTYLPEKLEIGSGLDQTKGPFQSEGKIQLFMKF